MPWIPEYDQTVWPKYLAIADALVRDIEGGILKEGEKLPTQRWLSYELGVTQGTIFRAYAEAERRGVIHAHVGRGSFVKSARELDSSFQILSSEFGSKGPIDLAVNKPIAKEVLRAWKDALVKIARAQDSELLLTYQPETGSPRHRAAAASWISQTGPKVSPDEILFTAGAQHGLNRVLNSLVPPGEPILCEEFTYTGMRTIAHQRHSKLIGVEIDEEGMVPSSLLEACNRRRARLLYTIPTHHNPMSVTASERRRRRIAEIARAHDLTILEDGVYDFMKPKTPPSYIELAPDRTIYVSSVSKALAPGLRVGFIVAKPPILEKLSIHLRASLWMIPPLVAAIFSEWMESGLALRAVEEQRKLVASRFRLAERYLGDLPFLGSPDCAHLFLTLPDHMTSHDLVAEAHQRNVILAPIDLFSADNQQKRNYIRIGLASPKSQSDLAQALSSIRGILSRG